MEREGEMQTPSYFNSSRIKYFKKHWKKPAWAKGSHGGERGEEKPFNLLFLLLL